MLKTGKPCEGNRSTFDITAEIQRELAEEPTGIMSILPKCNVSFKQSKCRLRAVKTRDVARIDAVIAVAIEHCEGLYLENRKRRPQDRGRKKRRKGKWNPIDRLWNSANPKNCSSEHLLEQD